MLTRMFWATLLLVAALAVSAPATAADPPGRATTTTAESGCVELIVARAGLITAVRELVPDRYTLSTLNANATRMNLTTYTCERIDLGGAPATDGAQPTTVVIGSAPITARDGVPTPGSYLLFYGTDNPVLFSQYQRLGLPVSFIPHTSSELDLGDVSSTLEWTLAGNGFDYHLKAVGDAAAVTLTGTTANFFYDGRHGDLRLRFANDDLRQSGSRITADLSQLEPLVPLLAQPGLACIPMGIPPCQLQDPPSTLFAPSYLRGSWTSTLAFE
jgi:hypothetical protein